MIHYHGTPISGTSLDAEAFLAGRDALIPWVAQSSLKSAAAFCRSFVFDNGAFTAWRKGKPIRDWSGYYDFVETWKRHPRFQWAIIPDVIDGDESANDALIDEWPHGEHSGVPVWHLHESLDRLHRLATRWPRVALGSSGQWRTPKTIAWWERIDAALRSICDSAGRPCCKLHGLRMLDYRIFQHMPLESADSTNAVRNASLVDRFGTYTPPTVGARMAAIARTIEQHQSASAWSGPPIKRKRAVPQASFEFMEQSQ